MPRYPTLLVLLVCAAGCSRRMPPTTAVGPAPRDTVREASPAEARPSMAGHPDGIVAPPIAAADTFISNPDSLAEQRLAADSAADQEVLEELAAARPAVGDEREIEAPGGAPKALANAASCQSTSRPS